MLFNLATFVPGVTAIPAVQRKLLARRTGTGGTDSARYSYSVWLRHLVLAHANGLPTTLDAIAELGPGDSLGMGLAALLSGASRYFAFDVVAHANAERNLAVFDELVSLFRNRTPIPANDEFPRVSPRLDQYAFPTHCLTDARLDAALAPARIDQIRAALRDCTSPGSVIQYRAPWQGDQFIQRGSIDMIFSQAVLEHVDDLRGVYRASRLWLKPTGFISHQVDLKSHGTSVQWNGHWTYSDTVWKVIRGKDSWLINRAPCSTHLRLLAEEGFRPVVEVRTSMPSSITRHDLARRFRDMPDEDLTTSGLFVQAVKA